MTDQKKKRMSMLDSLAAAGAPAPTAAPSMMSTNRALRSARDAVDSHQVWELDPYAIEDDRMSDRLDPADVADLRDAIETNGQTVPILVRRHPADPDRYLLVYGRRRLEAIRSSDRVQTIRALVASMDDDSALRAQISENMARRDLSFIEKALFAKELVEAGFGNQSQVAEVLTVTKSSVSMALAIVDMVGPDLVRAIGPAHGIGRPKWEALGKALEQTNIDPTDLLRTAEQTHSQALVDLVVEEAQEDVDPSVKAFDAVMTRVESALRTPDTPAPSRKPASGTLLELGGRRGGTVKRTGKGVVVTIDNSDFADWVEAQAPDLIAELHARWQRESQG
ncbi:MAG: plasmid partitioning protein RepB [Paracoccaceae bacterium]